MLMSYLKLILPLLILIIFLLLSVAAFTLVERKVMAAMQRRKGPNVVGPYGILQPIADGLKLFAKEVVFPSNANVFLFIFAPILTFSLSLMGWAVLPFADGLVLCDSNLGILYLLAISSLGVYGVLISGWSSNSKYSFLGSLRSTAQMVSYEVSIGFVLASVILCSESFNLSAIVKSQEEVWYFIPLLIPFIIFLVSILAETNRHPFDLPEAEAELVSGYNTEYSAMGFALFFLGEYANMLLMSGLTAVLFLGGWHTFPFSVDFSLAQIVSFLLKLMLFVIFFIYMRAALPRYRYDQLMILGWKIFLPLSMGCLTFTAFILTILVG